MGRRFGVAAAAALYLALVVPASAHQQAPAAGRSGWLPRHTKIGGKLTNAERAAAVARLEQIERILLQIPELARPQGFEIMSNFEGGAASAGS
ncbi:MAG: hypothetical protein ACRENP_05650 [Longimicrobiales bacterium]